MNITFSPSRCDKSLVLVKKGDMLAINGEVADFSFLEEGDVLPASAIQCFWIVGNVTRINGQIELTISLPLPVNYSQAQAFPEPLLNVADGPIELPAAAEVQEA